MKQIQKPCFFFIKLKFINTHNNSHYIVSQFFNLNVVHGLCFVQAENNPVHILSPIHSSEIMQKQNKINKQTKSRKKTPFCVFQFNKGNDSWMTKIGLSGTQSSAWSKQVIGLMVPLLLKNFNATSIHQEIILLET